MLQSRMSFGDHLEELRRRLIICLIALGLTTFVSFVWARDLVWLFVQPYEGVAAAANAAAGKQVLGPLQTIGVTEGFFAAIKAALLVGTAVASPVLLYQMWQFVAAGLYLTERRAVLYYLPLSFTLFLSGLTFGYFVMVPTALDFLLNFLGGIAPSALTLSNYFSFLIVIALILGVVFQIPMVMLFLARSGLVDPAVFSRQRRMFIFLAFIIGAILTPPDPVTQILMAGPIILLFELGIVLARIGKRKRVANAEPGMGSTGGA